MSLLADLDLSSYKDECIDAAHSLDRRRQAHETRHRRFRLQLRKTTRAEMAADIAALGATELVHHEELIHVPVKPVTGGVAFAPERMTVSNLEDVHSRIRGVARPDMKVYDRVVEVLDTAPAGLRKKDIAEIIGVSEFPVRKALEALEDDGTVTVRYEKTRGNGTPRKRYYPVKPQVTSIDPALGVSL